MEAELRKNQDILFTCGIGTMAFGVWSIIKIFMNILLKTDEGMSYIEGTDVISNIAYCVCVALLSIADLAIRYYILKCTYKEGRLGIDKGYFYIVLTAIGCFLSFSIIMADMVLSVIEDIHTDDFLWTMGTALMYAILEISSDIVSIKLIMAAVYLKKHRKELK